MTPHRPSMSGVLGLVLAALLVTLDVEAAPAASTGPGQTRVAGAKSGLKPLRVTSFRQLKRLLMNKHPRTTSAYTEMVLASVEASPAANTGAKSTDAGSGTQHSATNVQVEGVDEGDLVKTDGQYLYTLQGGQLRIIQAYPAAAMSLLASVKFDDGFYPTELYVDANRLVAIGHLWKPSNTAQAISDAERKVALTTMMPMGESLTVARVFNISDKRHPVQEREVSFTGSYLASRKVGDAVYLVGQTYPTYYTLATASRPAPRDLKAPAAADTSTSLTRHSALPKVGDSAVDGGKPRPLPLSSLSYFPNFVDPSYVVVAGFRLTEPHKPAHMKSYLGAGQIAYASLNTLYLSAADYRANAASPMTHIYSFAIDQGRTQFRQAGEVPGTVLNQFSMDEHNGYFRIATTVGEAWELGGHRWNNVYNLDPAMNVVGKVEHLAEGESIYAARFLGDRAYLVTFRQTDPLFVIDLADPTAPKALGELKLPGFSTYLHPYDDQHLLGIGQEVGEDGRFTQDSGMKLALFDVSDVAQPKLKHSLVIGARGTYSEALYDHKAVLFDRDRHLLGFPISETAHQPGEDWPTATFQGAHVYEVTLEGGFKKKAAITHMPEDSQRYYAWNRYIRRLLTIEDQLYTVSEGRIQANELGGFTQTGGLDVLELVLNEPVPIDALPVDNPPSDGAVSDPGDTAVACTMEVKICPDGITSVGRVPPSCEFAPCPAAQ